MRVIRIQAIESQLPLGIFLVNLQSLAGWKNQAGKMTFPMAPGE